ncbi:MAG: phenylacetate--CoA ligase family protein [Syntrophales bacterium]
MELKAREKWTREELLHFQARQLKSLVGHAARHSLFYKELYRHLRSDGPVRLEDLPVLDKRTMMEHFDRLVTDPRLKISDIHRHIERVEDDAYYLDEYRILTTAGSMGPKGVFVYSRGAWAVILAAVERASSFMGFTSPSPVRSTSIGSDSPLHLSYRRAASAMADIDGGKTQMLKATSPIEELVEELNAYQPDYIHTYPSIAGLLAGEQLEGHLHISPKVIVTGAETLMEDVVRNIRRAWGNILFNSYSATEGVLGVECAHHRGIHLFEDLCIVEVVDEKNRPVADGMPGHKILITNLYQYTQPLIRYQISDMITVSPERCACGRPFRLISEIKGRSDDIIYLEGEKGQPIAVVPIHFHAPIVSIGNIREYQITFKKNELHICLMLQRGSSKEISAQRVRRVLEEEIRRLGAKLPSIHVRFTDRFIRDPKLMGKMRMIVVER